MYGRQDSAAHAVLAGVAVDPIGGRAGQQLRADLEDRLNPEGAIPADPRYRLTVTLATSVAPIGVARDGTVSRYNVSLDSHYQLSLADGTPLTKGSVRRVGSYSNVTNAYFSTYVSEADAIERGVSELSEDYRLRLTAYFAQPRPTADASAPGRP